MFLPYQPDNNLVISENCCEAGFEGSLEILLSVGNFKTLGYYLQGINNASIKNSTLTAEP